MGLNVPKVRTEMLEDKDKVNSDRVKRRDAVTKRRLTEEKAMSRPWSKHQG